MALKNSRVEYILYIIIASPGLFLLVNKYQYLAIASFAILLILGLVFLIYKKCITQYHFEVLFILTIIYIYFALSYFVSNQTLSNFFSYNFLRYDGNFFFNYIPFFVLAIPYFNYRKVADILFKFIFFTFTAAAFIGLVEYLSNGFQLFFGPQNREQVFLVLNNAHNATGSVYAIVCIFLLAFLLKETKKFVKVLYACALVLCLVGLLLTRSRGSYIGFAVGAVIVLWLYYRSWVKFVITMLLLAGAATPLVLVTGTFDRIKNIFNFQEINVLARLVMWERAWDLFIKSPILGIGFGRYNDIIYADYWWDTVPSLGHFVGYPGIISFYMEPDYVFGFGHAHNAYFQFLAEVGIIGLFLIVIFWVLCYRRLLIGYNRTKDVFSNKTYLAGLGAIGALFALSLTENYFSATTVNICINMIVSLAIGIYWQESKHYNYDKK